MKLARVVFLIAGLWGIVVLVPFYFRFETIGEETPPAITHPEFYFGFLSAALAWQIAFLVVAADPLRFRPFMAAAVLEKFSYVGSIGVLYAQGRVALGDFTLGAVADFILGALFVGAFVSTRGARTGGGSC
jgi:hypothetical protein